MKIVLMSMPDVAAVIMHESAFHMPNNGIASVGANVDPGHEVVIIDLIRKRRRVRRYVTETLLKIRPDVIGLSAMAWQYRTCTKLVRLIKRLLPEAKIVLGGYHATLMHEEIAASAEAPLIDYIVRGEGEEVFRRLINALSGKDRVEDIPSLSYRRGNGFVHTPRGGLLDLSKLKLPIRDKRRLTWGYHIMNDKVEVIETSRGCTRACNFCSMNHMYGRTYRSFPMERILADIEDIYVNRKTRWIFVADDNLVLEPDRVLALCDAIIARRHRGLNFVVQADCITMARHEEMVRRMALAGFKTIFLGIENVSKKNLKVAGKGDIVAASRQAVANCHKYGIMVVAGMIFGFPDDDEEDIIENYRFLKAIEADTSYCQILTPYPKTGMRQYLSDEGLVTNADDFTRYNGMWANVRTRHLSAEQLQYLVWYHQQNVMGWWEPSERVRKRGPLWTGIWIYAFRPFLKVFLGRQLRKYGWRGRYERHIQRIPEVNRFRDLDLA
ncbi:MAG TPA: radical SAM protein [Desulfobacterales bacterium]|nr:radical SAM protein [Desulfobacterales bacterium]